MVAPGATPASYSGAMTHLAVVDVDSGEPRQPWDRLPNETDRAYYAFLVYRNQPPAGRSLRDLTRQLQAEREGVDAVRSPHTNRRLERWSVDNDWQARCAAWDRYQADLAATEVREQLVAMRTRHAHIAQAAIAKAVEKLTTLDARSMSTRDMIAMFDLGVRVERLSRGESSSAIEVAARSTEAPRPLPTEGDLLAILSALHEAGVSPEPLAEAG
jgi:hypothetical protein